LILILKRILLLLLILSGCLSLLGQEHKAFHVEVLDMSSSDLLYIDESDDIHDSLGFVNVLESKVLDLWSQGYILANVDSIFQRGDQLVAQVFVGKQYRFGKVEVSEKDNAMVRAAGLKNVRWRDKFLDLDRISQYAETLLTYLENHGYPFSNVYLDSTRIVDGKINANLVVSRKRFVPFDSLALFGKVDIRQGFMARYLNIHKKDPYSRAKINNITRRINDLTFVELDSTPVIKFANNTAQVQLYLKPKKASRFDFLIGILPSSDNGVRRLSVVGEFTGEMFNRLGQGEYIFANIQSRPETRVLDIRFKYPYLFDLPLGIDVKGGIFFNEQFRETIFNAGILYQFDGGSSLKASWNNKTSRLIEIDTSSILSRGRLPNQLDIAYNGGGLEYTHRNLDYRFNPTKGWQFMVNGTVGLKRIIRNNIIVDLSRPELDFSAAYDSLKLNTLQAEVNVSGAIFLPVSNIGTFKLGLVGGTQYNEERIFDNEFYRIGGNALLRGFDELSVLTNAYLVSTAEFRLLLDRNSYLSFPFIDYGITRVVVDEAEEWDNALGIGMGINFSTPAGIFNVSFAAGRRLGNPLDFGDTKIHFGYVSLF